jgi:hypothetical protein
VEHGLQLRSAPMRGAAAAAVAAAGTVMATQLLDFEAWHLRIRLLDSSYEWSWSHLVSTGAIGAGAVLCALGARAAAPGRRLRAWRVAAVLHEHLPHWPVLYAPVVAGLAAAVVVVAAGRPAARLVVAAVALLCASFAIHVAGPSIVRALGWSPYGFAFQVKVALKEGSELAGWVMLLTALARLASPVGDRYAA